MTCSAARRDRSHEAPCGGFTLIELVVVLVLTGLVASLVTGLVLRPMQAQVDIARRAALVDEASGALGRIARDVHVALPNSLRVSADGRSLELLRTLAAARYRSGPGTNPGGAVHTDPADWLDLATDASFDVLGRFTSLSFSYGTPLPSGTRLAIYTTDAGSWSDAALGANPGVITPSSVALHLEDRTDEDRVVLSAPFSFRYASPRQRLFVVEGPVSYVCDAAQATLFRVDGYAPAVTQPGDVAAAPLSAGRVAALSGDLASCSFAWVPGTASRAGLATIDLVLTRGGEQVRLLQQVHVEGTP